MILPALLSLGTIGAVEALILYIATQKFKVEQDPRLTQVHEALPGANCGGCGFPGCAGFAHACVNAHTLDGLRCPVCGNEAWHHIAGILGLDAAKADTQIATVKCNGTCNDRHKTSHYTGTQRCDVVNALYGGDTDCSYGCLGYGDCVRKCPFDAIHVNTNTGIAEVDENKCTACGNCVKACPKQLIELRKTGPKLRRIYVACHNKDKGAIARKACKNACIGCALCKKQCAFEAITIENNLAYIDSNKCRLCRKCVAVCKQNAIHEFNFPERKVQSTTNEGGTVPATAKITQPTTNEGGTVSATQQATVPAALGKQAEITTRYHTHIHIFLWEMLRSTLCMTGRASTMIARAFLWSNRMIVRLRAGINDDSKDIQQYYR